MTSTLEVQDAPRPGASRPRAPRARRTSSLVSHGEPVVWLMGAALIVGLLMIFGLVGLVAYHGGRTFWPRPIVRVETPAGPFLGEVTGESLYRPDEQILDGLEPATAERLRSAAAESEGVLRRRLFRTENFELTNTHYNWIDDALVDREDRPHWALCVERRDAPHFYGLPDAFLVEGRELATGPEGTWERLVEHLPEVTARYEAQRRLERVDLGRVSHRMDEARLDLREVELEHGLDSPEWRAEKARHDQRMSVAQEEFDEISQEIRQLKQINASYAVRLRTIDGQEKVENLSSILRAIPANQLDFQGRLRVYWERWKEFVSTNPRQANSAGGVWPAIFGTVVMTLLMTVVVVPFGVLAALYLRDYAKQGLLVSIVRIAVNNLAGVPSIVFGVFGFGFFCHVIGVRIDQVFFAAELPNPTYGTGGILWASLTLALLTLPVVIVATEEALSAVPNSMREGSYACGATKWQTIRRIVLPRAQPGIMTGMILAVARGAGEVAPLMLVGAAKYAPDLLVDLGRFPYVFPERSFMHLGFHIYDVGFQSQNSEAARPLVYTTTLLLIAIVVALNVLAVWIRARLRRKFRAAR